MLSLSSGRLIELNDTATYSYVANSPLVGQITFKQNGTTEMTTSKQYDDLNRLTQIASQPVKGSPMKAVVNGKDVFRPRFFCGLTWRYERPFQRLDSSLLFPLLDFRAASVEAIRSVGIGRCSIALKLARPVSFV